MKRDLFYNKNFILLFLSRLFSLIGTQMHRFGLPWLVLHISNNPSLMALNFTIGLIPGILFGTVGGICADRFNKKLIMIVGDSLSAVFTLVIFLMNLYEYYVSVNLLFILTFILSSISAVHTTSFDATLPEIVNKNEIVHANSVFSISQSFISLGGPMIAGMLIGFLGGWITILINGISFVISLLFIIFIKIKLCNENNKTNNGNILFEFVSGYRYIVKNDWLLYSMIVMSALFLSTGSVGSLIQLYLIKYLNLTGFIFGVTFALFEFVPMFLMSLLTPKLVERFPLTKLILVNTIIFSISVAMMGVTTNYYIVVIFGAILNGAAVVALISWNTLRQKYVQSNNLGKVIGFSTTIQSIFLPLGGAISSLLLKYLSAQFILVIFGLMSLFLVLPCIFKFKYLKNKY